MACPEQMSAQEQWHRGECQAEDTTASSEWTLTDAQGNDECLWQVTGIEGGMWMHAIPRPGAVGAQASPGTKVQHGASEAGA